MEVHGNGQKEYSEVVIRGGNKESKKKKTTDRQKLKRC
jgi:hypothetical protein